MPALLPFALAAGLVLVAAASTKKKPGAPGAQPPGAPPPPFPPSKPPGTTACALDTTMPVGHQQATQALLSNTAIPASTLLAAAQIAETSTYPLAAQCLRDEATRRGGGQEPPEGFNPLDPSTWPEALGFPAPGAPPVSPPPPGAPPGVQPTPCPHPCDTPT